MKRWRLSCHLQLIFRGSRTFLPARYRLRLPRQRDHNLHIGLSAELGWDLAVKVKAGCELHRGSCGQKRWAFLVQHFSTRGADSLCITTLVALIRRKPAVVNGALENYQSTAVGTSFPCGCSGSKRRGNPQLVGHLPSWHTPGRRRVYPMSRGSGNSLSTSCLNLLVLPAWPVKQNDIAGLQQISKHSRAPAATKGQQQKRYRLWSETPAEEQLYHCWKERLWRRLGFLTRLGINEL